MPGRAVNLAVITRHRQGQPFLQLVDRQDGSGVRIVASTLGRIGERRPRQLMHHLHQRPNDVLDDPAIMRTPWRPIIQLDPVLLTPPTQRFTFELRSIIPSTTPAAYPPLAHGYVDPAAPVRHVCR